MKKTLPCLFVLSSILSMATIAEELPVTITPQNKEIAITIDDLPFVGGNGEKSSHLRRTHERFMSIVDSLVANQVPATGFVIAGSIAKGQWELLEAFRKEGFGLGNHTYSHESLDRLSATQYMEEISRADKILAPVMTQPKYFRYPYLAEGKEPKKHEIHDYLAANQYVVAPVTIDTQDYKFNERLLKMSSRIKEHHIESIKKQYLTYMWKQTIKAEKYSKKNSKQILLIHANLLNSYCLNDIIHMYKEHGYRFISLTEALTNSGRTLNTIQQASSHPDKPPTDDPLGQIPTQSAKNENNSHLFPLSEGYSQVGWLSDWE